MRSIALLVAATLWGLPATFGSSLSSAGAAPKVSTTIRIGGTGPGRTFDGVGAISGGGGNSRLLMDYPPAQRDQILDYLFKPGYGASLQILKLEIGGDSNSTDGSELSVEHTRGEVNCNAGYEFWVAEQAKLRNPAIKLYGLAWAAPGWIGNGHFWSKDMIQYLMTWMGCAKSHGLTIDYLGGWNERGFNKRWYGNLHAALRSGGYSTEVVGDDLNWKVADAMGKDPAFARSIDIIGVHYSCEGGDGGDANSCHSTKTAREMNKPLWDSESGSQDENKGAGPLIRAITRGYIDARMTALLNWPLVAAITPNLPYPTTGLMVAAQPWSGSYSVGKSLWVIAQVTQFSRPGWKFVDDASGYLGGSRTHGSYITLRSPKGNASSTIVETTTSSDPSDVTFLAGGDLQDKPIHIWATNLRSTLGKDEFVHVADLNSNGSGRYHFVVLPGHVYTFSTIGTAGRGFATPPPSHNLELPYRDDFNEYPINSEARYAMSMQGAFQIQPCAAGRAGKCLQQMALVKPIRWMTDNMSEPFLLLGDPSWTNYDLSVDAELSSPGGIELIGRAGMQKGPQRRQQGYFFRISDSGAWKLFKSTAAGKHTRLARGKTAALGTKRWHRLSMSLDHGAIAIFVDGKRIVNVDDPSYEAGQIGLGFTNYAADQLDDLSITPISVAERVAGGNDLRHTNLF